VVILQNRGRNKMAVIKGVRGVIKMLRGAVADPGNRSKLAQAKAEAKAALKKLDEKGAAGTASDDKNAAQIQRLLREASGASVARTGRTPARETARGGVQLVTRDGATDLGTPAGTRSSGSGRGVSVQSKVKPQTLATRFDALKPGARRAERLLGDKSIYSSVMKQRAGTPSTRKGTPTKLAPVGKPPAGFGKGGLKKAKSTYNKGGVAKKKPVKKLAKGGFPDLTGDGKVTKKDVLKGRGVAMNMGGMKKKYGASNYMYGGSVMGKKKK